MKQFSFYLKGRFIGSLTEIDLLDPVNSVFMKYQELVHRYNVPYDYIEVKEEEYNPNEGEIRYEKSVKLYPQSLVHRKRN